MGSFFSVEGPLFSGLDRMADLFWLNILFIVCCIPVVTIGASTTALYYVTLKMVKNEESHITKSFFRAFKDNFRQSTVIWLLALLIGGILFADYSIMSGAWIDISTMPGIFRKVMLVILLIAALLYAIILRYVFPLLARFDNTIKNTMRNALLIGIRHLPFTGLLLLIVAAAVAIFYFIPTLRVAYIIIMFSLVAFLSSFIFVKIFSYYMPEEPEKDPDAFVLGGDEQDPEK
ncbi:MAG: YesL family protein [Lachnospiraceae bacterium]|nr:YesL family protein [Lachnospiraceae bacterium]